MSGDDAHRIQGLGGAAPPPALAGSAAAAGSLDATEFQRLLAQLEALRHSAAAPTGEGSDPPIRGDEDATRTDDLAAALRQADEDYVKVMEVRQRLEDAFRRHAGDR